MTQRRGAGPRIEQLRIENYRALHAARRIFSDWLAED